MNPETPETLCLLAFWPIAGGTDWGYSGRPDIGTPTMQDFRFLIKKTGHTWSATRRVPRHLHGILGKAHLRESLKTRDVVEARQRRWAALARFQTIIDSAQQQHGAGATMAEAIAWREHIAKLKAGDTRGIWDSRFPQGGEPLRRAALACAADSIDEAADQIASRYGQPVADTFVGIASGTATPSLFHVDSWLREGGAKGPLNLRTQGQYRSVLTAFAAWCEGSGVPGTVEAITKAVAGRYVAEGVAAGLDPATHNSKITALSSYWRYLIKRTPVTVNPWSGQSRSTAGRNRHGERKRAFTDLEVRTLLDGPADQELADVIRLGALTGARLDELYRLRVSDCAYGIFNIRRSKSAAGVRTFPIHSALVSLVDRRCEGKQPGEFLMHEAGAEPKAGRERSMPMSKRFGRYRIDLGVHEIEPGRRQSNVDYHSFRRWFSTRARQAGIDVGVVDQVTGHVTGSLTDDLYSAGFSAQQKRECVEAVKLPEPVEPA